MRMRFYHEEARMCTKPCGGTIPAEGAMLSARYVMGGCLGREPFVSDKVSANGLLVQANGGKLLAWDAFCATMGHDGAIWGNMGQYGTWGGLCAISRVCCCGALGKCEKGIYLLSLGLEVAVTLRLLRARVTGELLCLLSLCHFSPREGKWGRGNGMMPVGRFTPMTPR